MAKKRNVKKGNAKAHTKKNEIPKEKPAESIAKIEAITTGLVAMNLPVLLKVCRLCQAKDGPFLNIFDADGLTARKIEDVMPFAIVENDDLPHKICFRCSAKVEELYEFIQKCVKTQESLREVLGKAGALTFKSKARSIWEEKLNKSNISNDDICDALIKKAMESIKDIPFPLQEHKDVSNVFKKEVKSKKKNVPKNVSGVVPKEKDNSNNIPEDVIRDDEDDLPLKRDTDLSIKFTSDLIKNTKKSKAITPTYNKLKSIISTKPNPEAEEQSLPVKPNQDLDINKKSQKDCHPMNANLEIQPKANFHTKFDIMDHISMIKVNGVGVLLQCKLCNRNFLKKEVVLSHACAKNSAAKIEAIKDSTPPEPPKLPVVKYITTRPDSELKKPIILDDSPITVDDDDDEDNKPLVRKKPKPKIGPASKVKKTEPFPTETPSTNCSPQSFQQFQPVQQINPSPYNPYQVDIPPAAPTSSVQFPAISILNCRYKLVPGRNNTFLVEERQFPTQSTGPTLDPTSQNTLPPLIPLISGSQDRKQDIVVEQMKIGIKRAAQCNDDIKTDVSKKPPEPTTGQPYPVGLFQTLSHNETLNSLAPPAASFETPSIKKQSYTVVQTGNPSKLLISSKQQPSVEEVPKKKIKKGRVEDISAKQPFSVTLEDAAPPKDSNFFTFINVDPLLQPSYVLPTNNIIQESRISTSTNVVKQAEVNTSDVTSKYVCNMCNEKFTREKKLLAHMQLHFNKMDQEEKSRFGNDKNNRSLLKRRARNT